MVELCFTGVAVDAFNFGAVYSGHFAVNLNLRACVKIILRLANLWASRLYAGNVGKHTYITVATFRTAPLFLCWRKRIVHTRVAQTWSFSSIPRVWLKLEPVSLPPVSLALFLVLCYTTTISCNFPRYDVMGLILFIVAARLGYLYALKFVRHLSR